MNIKEYVENLNEIQFEELCTEYLQWLYRGKKIQIHGTRLRKDGGKDAVGIAEEVPYEIWAEFKKHCRSVGLEEIAKNVVLVLSKGINELLFFSTSNITRNAIKHISIVSKKHDFSVSFYYGQRLYAALEQLPRFHCKEENRFKSIPKTLLVHRYFSVFEDTDEYTKENKLTLQRDNNFYIDLYLTNLYDDTISEIECVLPKVDGINFSVSEIDKNFKLLKGSNRVLQIRAEVLNCYSVKYIPKITIKYSLNGKKEEVNSEGGWIDPTKLIYYPLTGVDIHKFLREKTVSLFTKSDTASPYMVRITGTAGSGKSRLLMELLNKARGSGFQTLYCDAKKQDGFFILREWICVCLGLPFGKGNISCTLEDFQSVIERYNGSKEIAEAVYNFVFLEQTDETVIYYMKEALIYFSLNIIGHIPLFLALDNLQCLNEETLNILYFVINRLQNSPARVIFGLCANTEIVPSENIDSLTNFLDKISAYDKSRCLPYECDELSENDAKLLYFHAIWNLRNYNSLTELLVNKSGKRPFDIIMTIHLLHDKEIVKLDQNNHWNIKKTDELENVIKCLPQESKKLISDRFKLQRKKEFTFKTSIPYYDTFRILTKSVLYFGGAVPIEFINTLQIDEDMLFELNQSFFFKYDEKDPTILFYHDNIYRFFENYRSFLHDRTLSLQIIKWLEENEWYKFNMRSTIIFDCYIRACEYKKGKEFGISAVKEESQKRNYESVVKIGEELLNNTSIKLCSSESFFVNYYVADAYRTYSNLSKSIDYFDKAYEVLSTETIPDFSEMDKCRFFHCYVNAYIAEPRYDGILNALDKFKNGCTRDAFYEFIMNNRASVAYLALEDIDNALASINKSLEIAKEKKKPQWESISYSDKAYIYYRAYEDKDKTIDYFIQAVNNHKPDEASINRSSEILAQEAFKDLLEGNIPRAITYSHKALERALDINGTAMEIKSRNLYAISHFFSGDVEEATNLWNKDILIATQRKSLDGLTKVHTNIGASMLLNQQLEDALCEFEKAHKIYTEHKLSRMTHKPLIYNLMYLYHICRNNKKRDKLLENEYFENLASYYNQLISAPSAINTGNYWPLQYNHVFFNY